MENTNKENTLCMRKSSEMFSECAAEYILPDYKGDVKRILHTETRVLPSGSFSDAAQTEFAGIVAFDVLYLDAENKLTSVSFSTDYSFKLPAKDGVRAEFADYTAENVNVRLPGPRKMLARCAIKCEIKSECCVGAESTGSTFAENLAAEVCKTVLKTEQMLSAELRDREYAEELAFIPGAALDDIEVVAKRAEAKIASVCAESGAVKIAGEINIYTVLKNGDSAPIVKDMRIPFEEIIEAPGATEGSEALAKAVVSSLECPANPTEDGVRLSVSVVIDISACALTNEQREVITDAYTPFGEVENKYESVKYDEFIGARRQNAKINCEIPKSKTDAECASDIVYMSTEVKADSVKTESSSVTVSGEVRFSGVACEIYEDGTPTYTSLRFSVPFSESVNFGTQIPQNSSVEYSVESSDAHVSLDETNFYAECGICLAVSVFAAKEASRLVSSDVMSDALDKRSSHVVSVYYPEEGDTLFGVAKKFKVSASKIAEDNALTAEAVSMKNAPLSLASTKKLIIKN